jgi:tetratricopeptide (TPR) repeat protein
MAERKPRRGIDSRVRFEIKFYERLLKDKPEFADALAPLAEAYTRAGWHEKGLAIDQKLSRLRPDDGVVFYNLACSYSLLEKLDEAFKALGRAIELGYNDFAHMDTDADLSRVRADLRYQQIVARVVKQKGANHGMERSL